MYKKNPFYFSSLLGAFCQGAFVLFPCNMFTEEDMDNLPDLGISPTEGAQNLESC